MDGEIALAILGITLGLSLLLSFFWLDVKVHFELANTKHYAKIKFESFVAFYNLKSDSWELKDNFVMYIKRIDRGWGYDTDTTLLGFSFPDLLKYRKWKKRQKKIEKTMQDAKELQAVVDDIKSEIEKLNRKNAETMKSELEKLRKWSMENK